MGRRVEDVSGVMTADIYCTKREMAIQTGRGRLGGRRVYVDRSKANCRDVSERGNEVGVVQEGASEERASEIQVCPFVR